MKSRWIQGLSVLALVVCLGMQVFVDARTASAQGEPPREPERLDDSLRPAPLAHSQGGDNEGKPQAGDPQGFQLAPLNLDFRLVGTVVADAPEGSLAVIENKFTGEQRGCLVGDQVGEVLIKEILFGRVVIQTSFGEAVLYVKSKGMTDAFPVPPHGSPSPVAYVDKQELDSALPDYTDLIKEIRMRPRFSGGRPHGFVIYNIAPESLLDRMGLKDGDVIVGVNDTSFSTTQPVVEFYEALKAGGTVSFKVERDEGIQDLRIEFTGAN